jgi:predicted dehydrogenase
MFYADWSFIIQSILDILYYEKYKYAIMSSNTHIPYHTFNKLMEASMNRSNGKKLHVAVVGMGFGAEFVPIYQIHPDVRKVTICDQNEERLDKNAKKFGIANKERDFKKLLADPDINAIHLISGIPDHAQQSVAVLESGKHCACTVPMATSIKDLQAIISAQRASGTNYMMMETAVYTRQFLYAQELLKNKEFGRLQFLRGAHYQCMEQWPSYWAGLPPMWYATHAVSPLLAIARTRAAKVHCFGSGEMRPELHRQYGNPYPVETAIFQLEKPNLSAEVTRTLFHCGRDYMESFVVYGENACYEWQNENDDPILHRATPVTPGTVRRYTHEQPVPPDRADVLPPEVGKFTRRHVYSNAEKHLSFDQGGGHHGSHPHLVHEFVRSIMEQRKPAIDEITAANWTAAGICAHESAMNNGREVTVPSFD